MGAADLTQIICPSMSVYPGTEPPELHATANLPRDGFRETLLHLTSHTGTHVDAPAHLLPAGKTLDRLPVTQFFGKAVVLRCSGQRAVTLSDLAPIRDAADAADFLLLDTGWSAFWGTAAYFDDFPLMDAAFIQYLIDSGKRGVGLDAISVDPVSSSDLPKHRQLLCAGLLIVENLCNLAQLPQGLFDFFALPLPYENADGAPVRAIATWE